MPNENDNNQNQAAESTGKKTGRAQERNIFQKIARQTQKHGGRAARSTYRKAKNTVKDVRKTVRAVAAAPAQAAAAVETVQAASELVTSVSPTVTTAMEALSEAYANNVARHLPEAEEKPIDETIKSTVKDVTAVAVQIMQAYDMVMNAHRALGECADVFDYTLEATEVGQHEASLRDEPTIIGRFFEGIADHCVSLNDLGYLNQDDDTAWLEDGDSEEHRRSV